MRFSLDKATRVIKDGLSRPAHLAWDWLGRNFYFFSEGYIEVCNHNGTYCLELLAVGLNHINSLLVVPEEGYLFLSVWGDMASQTGFIERSDMDGQRRRRIIAQVRVCVCVCAKIDCFTS